MVLDPLQRWNARWQIVIIKKSILHTLSYARQGDRRFKSPPCSVHVAWSTRFSASTGAKEVMGFCVGRYLSRLRPTQSCYRAIGSFSGQLMSPLAFVKPAT